MPYKDPQSEAARINSYRRSLRYFLKDPERRRKQKRAAQARYAATHKKPPRSPVEWEHERDKRRERNFRFFQGKRLRGDGITRGIEPGNGISIVTTQELHNPLFIVENNDSRFYELLRVPIFKKFVAAQEIV
jgi:hypothetical protein